ncbi:MAG: DUF1385 domain-containing protein [Oscillospiraceae bacterium]|nr:DUF1385 domain-containing protein [Oscillospiraceae bacterium]MDE6839904.1 DUF1385 domain-containing protein [Oscillospiraceae bacterium]
MARQDKNCCTPFKTTCGGQALLEGILMQGPEKRAIVVRRPNGELSIEEEAVKPRSGLAKLPFIRGLFIFGGSMVHGMKALMRSAELSDDGSAPEEELTGLDKWISDHFEQDKAMGIIITLAAVLGIAFSIGLFILLPTALTGLLGLVWTGMPLWVRSVIEGVLKVAIFMIYLYLCSKMKEIHRVFEYHGAEHKTIYCYENGLELTVENVRRQPRHHPRCGTSFLFVVIAVSIFLSIAVFTPLKIENTFLRMGLHLLMLPLIVGVTYEFNRYVGGHDGPVCRALRAPGMWMQNFTTFEPDDSMIEVGIEALKRVLPEEKGADQW